MAWLLSLPGHQLPLCWLYKRSSPCLHGEGFHLLPLSQCQEMIENAGFEISNWMHLSVGQVDCKNHLSECTIYLSEIYKANATYVKIRNTQSSVGQALQILHLSDCHFYSSQMVARVKFRALKWNIILWFSKNHSAHQVLTYCGLVMPCMVT